MFDKKIKIKKNRKRKENDCKLPTIIFYPTSFILHSPISISQFFSHIRQRKLKKPLVDQKTEY